MISVKRTPTIRSRRPIVAHAIQQHFLRTRMHAVVQYTPAIQHAFVEQRAAVIPQLGKITDLRQHRNPHYRADALASLVTTKPLAKAMVPLYVNAVRAGSGFAGTLIPPQRKGWRPWWTVFERKQVDDDLEIGDLMDLPQDVRNQFPKLGQRIVKQWQSINQTTVNRITGQVEEGMRRGYTPLQIAQGYPKENYDGVAAQFEDAIDWRAEMIARTETANGYNWGAWQTYSDAGIRQVEAIDGDDDSVCAERNGQVYDMGQDGDPIDNGYGTEDHPNGSLTWAPVVTG